MYENPKSQYGSSEPAYPETSDQPANYKHWDNAALKAENERLRISIGINASDSETLQTLRDDQAKVHAILNSRGVPF